MLLARFSTFQKIILTKLFKQPLKRLFNPFLLFFVQRQFRSAPKHIRSLSITVDIFNSRNSRHVSIHLNSAQALAASGALRSAAFTPLQFTHISTHGKFSTLSSIRPVKRPEGLAGRSTAKKETCNGCSFSRGRVRMGDVKTNLSWRDGGNSRVRPASLAEHKIIFAELFQPLRGRLISSPLGGRIISIFARPEIERLFKPGSGRGGSR